MENKDLLTERIFWEEYWNNKRDTIVSKVPETGFHQQELDKVISANAFKSAVELGGFPGTFSVYIKKKHQLETTLVDYFIDRSIVDDLVALNGLKPGSIELIEDDLTLNHEVTQKYDLVFSIGLIEHFLDTKAIIKRHIDYMNEPGELLIMLPNFKGINGWLQRKFDRSNYDAHNIDCMDLDLLRSITQELGLKDVSVYYKGKFSIWLENIKTQPLPVKLFMKSLFFAGKAFTKIVPVESKALSPLIVIRANNSTN